MGIGGVYAVHEGGEVGQGAGQGMGQASIRRGVEVLRDQLLYDVVPHLIGARAHVSDTSALDGCLAFLRQHARVVLGG